MPGRCPDPCPHPRTPFRLKARLRLAAAAAGTVAMALAVPAGAAAETVRTTADLSLRTGPDTTYERIAVIPEGAAVEASRCVQDYSWCEVAWRSYTGWSAARYLRPVDRDTGQPTAADEPSVAEVGADLALPVLDFLAQVAAGEEDPRLRLGLADDNRAEEGDDDAGEAGDQPASRPATGQVCFYADFDYAGERRCVDASGSNDGFADAWNDRISSIRVGAEARVEICEHYDFGGRCRVVAADQEALEAAWNDTVSSWRKPTEDGSPDQGDRVAVRPGEVCFFEHVDFDGRRFCAESGRANAGLGDRWNDTVSSIKVGANARVEVCEDYDFGGECRVLRQDAADLTGGWNDRISSYRPPQDEDETAAAPEVGAGQPVCFYEHYDFEGRHFCAEPNSRNAGLGESWNDVISSIALAEGATVEVCEDYDFAGTCRTLDGDNSGLSGRWNDAISSYRVVR